MYPVNILLDTGASISLVSVRLVDILNLNANITPTDVIITGLANKAIPMRGQITLPLKLGNTTVKHVFIVTDNIDNEFLIGMDIIQKFKMCIDVSEKKVCLPDGTIIPYSSRPISITKRMKIRCNKTITVPANTVLFLSGKLPICNASKNYEGVIEPYNNLTKNNGLVVMGSLSYSNLNIIPVQCVNPYPWDVTVRKNQLIAFIEPFQKLENVQKVKKVTNSSDFYDASINIPRLPNAEPVDITKAKGKWENPLELIKKLRIDDIDITDETKSKLKSLISEFSHCFSKNNYDLGTASFYEARLNLKRDFQPRWIPSRAPSHKVEKYMDSEIENLQKSGQIEHCKYSLWNSIIFAVNKPTRSDDVSGSRDVSGSYRFVVDARAINSQIIRDHHSLPKISTIFDRISECKYWSSFDLTSSFTQIGLDENSRPITAFTYKGRQYQWTKMIQGACNSSSEFSRMIGQLFSSVPFNLLCYIDDILLSSNTEEEHLKRLRFILERLEWANLKLGAKKTHLFCKSVIFCGYRLSAKGLQIDEQKVKAITELPAPTNIKQIQKFLGMINFHRNFIPKFAEKASPLYNLLRKNIKFNWDKSCQDGFDALKNAMAEAPILGFIDFDDKYQSLEVVCDSSKRGHGAVLTQSDGKERHIISYFSQSVPKHHQKLGATKLELLGLLAALRHWRLFLHGRPFRILTDCRALLNLETIFNKEGSYMQRRVSELAGYNFTIEHVSGASEEIKIADYLSRYGSFKTKTKTAQTQTNNSFFKNLNLNSSLEQVNISPAKCRKLISDEELDNTSDSEENMKSEINEIIDLDLETKFDAKSLKRVLLHNANSNIRPRAPVTINDIKSAYQDDKLLLEVIKWVKDDKRPDKINYRNCQKELFQYWKNFKFLSIIDDVLYIERRDPNNFEKSLKLIVVPYSLIERILYSYHNTLANCHSGIDNSLAQCQKTFYFYKMKQEFKLWIQACLTCCKTKQAQAYGKMPMKPIVYSHFGQAISIDHLEPSKTPTPRGNVALLTITDMFTSYLVCIPVKSMTTEETIKQIIEHWILKFGIPLAIHHDLAKNFTSKFFQTVLRLFEIEDKPGTSFHSQTQGKVESQNRRLNICFRACLTEKEYKNYDLYVKYIVFALNCMRSSRTGYSANFLVFGRELTMARDLFVSNDSRMENLQSSDKTIPLQTHAYEFYKQVRDITRKALEHTKRAVQYQCNQYNKHLNEIEFKKGQYCFLLSNTPKHKYSQKWLGPFEIVEKISSHNYIVNCNGNNKIVNVSKMKLYKGNKYTQIPQSSEYETADDTVVSNKDKIKSKTAKRKIHDSSSSSEDEIVVTFSDSGKATPIRRPNRESSPSSSRGTSTPTNPVTPSTSRMERSRSTEGFQTPESTPRNPSRVQDLPDNTPNSRAATIDQNPGASSSATSARSISMPDIDRHAISRGLPTQRPARDITRATGVENLEQRSSSRYGLRPRINAPKKFGFPTSSKKSKK